MRHTKSYQIASGMMHDALCDIVFSSIVDYVQADDAIYYQTNLCERVCYKANMVMSTIWEFAVRKETQRGCGNMFAAFLVTGK